MTTPPKRGLYVTFEGIDGSGKSSALTAVFEALQHNGRHALLPTREPGSVSLGEGGQAIRGLLLDPARSWCNEAELFLFLADRAQHMHEVVDPHLCSGYVVLSDRGPDSTVAYQAYGRGLGERWPCSLSALNDAAMRWRQPDLTLVFDLPVSAARARLLAASKADRLDSLPEDFHQRVRDGFLTIARNHYIPGDPLPRYVVIDADQSPAIVHAQAIAAVWQRITQLEVTVQA